MFRKASKNFIYGLIFIIPFVLFFLNTPFFSQTKHSLIQVLSGPIRLISSPIQEIKKIFYYNRTFQEYRKLRQEVDFLRNRVVGEEELLQENARFEQLLEFKRKLLYSAIPASVIGRNPSYWNSSLVVDKGEVDGIKQGMAVVTSGGLIGKIAEVGAKTSKVLMLTDPDFNVAALVQRSRESVLLSGTLEGICRLKFVNKGADIRVGDLVMTSKLSSSFPESLLIGYVTAIDKRTEQKTPEYVLKPAVSLSQLEEVLIVEK